MTTTPTQTGALAETRLNDHIDLALMQDCLIINLEYCGSCRGACPTCVLSMEERADPLPYLDQAATDAILADIARDHPVKQDLILGVGRGNVLAMGPDSIDDLVAMCRSAERHFRFTRGHLEITTSLAGRVNDQIDRAAEILTRFEDLDTRFDPRFVIVANPANHKPAYWDGIYRFTRDLMAYRAGQGTPEDQGDIIQLNLDIATLPSMDWLEQLVGDYLFPVNIVWVPALDGGARTEEGLAKLSAWLVDFIEMVKRRELDNNLLNRIQLLGGYDETDPDILSANLRMSGKALIYVGKDGKRHEGIFSALGDMDPIRFDPEAAFIHDEYGQRSLVDDPKRDLRLLMRNKACRACPHMAACVVTGAYKAATVNLRHFPKGTSVCPAGVREVFDANPAPFAPPETTKKAA